MLKHRTNRADVLAAFERYENLTGDTTARLLCPGQAERHYYRILGGCWRVGTLPPPSGPWWSAKEAYLAISRFCDQLEAKEAAAHAKPTGLGYTIEIGEPIPKPVPGEPYDDPPTYAEALIDAGRGHLLG